MPIDVFMPFAEMEKNLREIEASAPDLVKLDSYGLSRQGRKLYYLTITDFSTGPAEDKPAFFLQAHIHCHELAGTPAVLDFARKLVREHKKGGILETTAFYLVPRINPDGGEHVILHSGYTRSRWKIDETKPNRYVQGPAGKERDTSCFIRIETPYGDLCKDPYDPRCLVPREPWSKGPFYKLFHEGSFENWDGQSTETKEGLDDGTLIDMNRNWPSNWTPNQAGAGDYPGCETEVRQTLDFLFAHRNIFSALCFHNGWGGILLPPNGKDSAEIPAADRDMFSCLGDKASELTGYPSSPASRFTFEGEPPVYAQGNFDDCMYFLFGIYSITIELGTRETSSGLDTRTLFSSKGRRRDSYTAPREVIASDDAHPEYRKAFQTWKKIHHPQFGDVEIGGQDNPAFAVPDPDWLEKLYPKTSEFLEFYAMHRPCVEIAETHIDDFGNGIRRVRIVLFNHGDFPTNVTEVGKTLPAVKVPEARFKTAEGCKCLSRRQNFEIGHLGRYQTKELEWFVQGTGKIGKFEFLCGAGGNTRIEL